MRRKVFQTAFQSLLVIVLATNALGQQQQSGGVVQTGDVSVERLRAHITYLASDKLDGRRTGTAGAWEASVYIAREFERYGLRDGNSMQSRSKEQSDSYMQSFPYVSGVELGRGNAMTFATLPVAINAEGRNTTPMLDLRVGEDWMPLAWSANARVGSMPVTYVGYGITATELGHDDYAGVDVKNRIALAFAGTPDGDNPHGSYSQFADLRFKAAAAKDHGALALVIIAREENFKDDRLARLRIDESAASGDAGLPVAVISRQVARRAFESAAAQPPLAAFEKMEAELYELPPPPHGAEEMQTPSTATAVATTAVAAAHPVRGNHSKPLDHVGFQLATDIVRREAPAANVVGVLEGSDAKLKNEYIVIGAHYDHLGRGGQGSLAQREGEIHHGADDNASGVAGLLELARTLSLARKSVRRSIVFIAFSGEEEGLLGSSYYVKNPSVPLAQTVAMINLDMVGRLRENKLLVGGVGTSSEWKNWIAKANGQEAAPAASATSATTTSQRFALTMTEDGFGPSDHASFYANQMPVLFFWTGTHEDYHKPSDTADRINYEGEQQIVSFIRDITRALDANGARPAYMLAKSDAAAGRSTGFRVYLGTIPNYAETTDGLKLDGVREDSPAAKAGLKANDVIVKLAGREVRNVYDYTYALGEMKAGVETEVEIRRAGERLTLKLTPAARK